MKKSNYNYIIPFKNQTVLCFNSITWHFFEAKSSSKDLLADILNDPKKYKELMPHFYEKLIDGGFIIEDHSNEIDIIKSKYTQFISSKSCMLVILPTLDCNFSCWYCIQKHQKGKMSDSVIEKIKKLIYNKVSNREIEHLLIEWFGGEPFLYFEEVIKPISTYAEEICKKFNVKFDNSATTNGYLITSEKISQLTSLSFRRFHITLDGDKEHHDKNRVAINESSFDTILENINSICQSVENVEILLRINYDAENFDPDKLFSQIINKLDSEIHYKVKFSLRKIWQAKTDMNTKDKLYQFIEKIKKTSFKFIDSIDLKQNYHSCYANHPGMKLISYDGFVGKCTAKVDFSTNPLGYITDDGFIKWNNNLPIDDLYSKPIFDNKVCLACKHLPLCMGPCPKNIDESKEEFQCKGRTNDFSFIDSIRTYCEYVNSMEV